MSLNNSSAFLHNIPVKTENENKHITSIVNTVNPMSKTLKIKNHFGLKPIAKVFPDIGVSEVMETVVFDNTKPKSSFNKFQKFHFHLIYLFNCSKDAKDYKNFKKLIRSKFDFYEY